MILAIELDFRAGILAKKYLVSRFNVQGNHLAVFLFSRTDRYDFALLGLLLSGIRNKLNLL
jgi:hypothetical protein